MAANRDLLVIEPSAHDRERLAETLRRKGMRVESASDATGVTRIASQRYAMVVIDSATPGVDGALVAESLRGVAPRPIVLVIIDGVELPRGFGADATHGFIRRGDSEQLAEIIRDCITALSGTGSQPVATPGLSLRVPQ